MSNIRDTYKYTLEKDGVIILRGVTSDLTRRCNEHQVRYPNSVVVQVGSKTNRKEALNWLRSFNK